VGKGEAKQNKPTRVTCLKYKPFAGVVYQQISITYPNNTDTKSQNLEFAAKISFNSCVLALN